MLVGSISGEATKERAVSAPYADTARSVVRWADQLATTFTSSSVVTSGCSRTLTLWVPTVLI